METENIVIKKLVAQDGMWITNKEETTFAKVMYLGSGDSTDNYHEMTNEQYQTRLAELDANAQAEINTEIQDNVDV